MRKLFKCLGKLGVLILICMFAPIILTVVAGIFGFTSVNLATLGAIFLVLCPGIIIGILIANSDKE